MDIMILNFIQSIRNPVLDAFFKFYTTLGDFGLLWIVILLILFVQKKTRSLALWGAFALIIEFILVDGVLKYLVQRDRPFITYPLELIVKAPHGYSFPSGHAASSLAVSYFLFRNDVPLRRIILGAGFLMAFSRLYVYVHYPTDVFVGVVVGMGVAVAVDMFMKRPSNHLPYDVK